MADNNIRKGPPLPIGQPVKASMSSLTPLERAAFTKSGSPTLQQQVALATQKTVLDLAAARNQIPVPMNTPPVQLNPLDVRTLPPEQQQQFKKTVHDMLHGNTDKPYNMLPQTEAPAEQIILGAVQPVPQPAFVAPPVQVPLSEVASRIAGTQMLDIGDLGEIKEPQPAAVSQPAPAQAAAHATAGETTGATTMVNCPHCSWPLSEPDIPEPSEHEKRAFLQTLLGDIQFSKSYSLFSNSITLTFRSLTIAERDVCWRKIQADVTAGEVTTTPDFSDRLGRYWLALQLQRIQVTGGRDILMPDGFNKANNRNATRLWSDVPDVAAENKEALSDQELLKNVTAFIATHVLSSDTLMRVAFQCCGRFNKFIAKLESMADSSDFFHQTGSASS